MNEKLEMIINKHFASCGSYLPILKYDLTDETVALKLS